MRRCKHSALVVGTQPFDIIDDCEHPQAQDSALVLDQQYPFLGLKAESCLLNAISLTSGCFSKTAY